jgi:hypothetical protein
MRLVQRLMQVLNVGPQIRRSYGKLTRGRIASKNFPICIVISGDVGHKGVRGVDDIEYLGENSVCPFAMDSLRGFIRGR